MTEKLYPFTFSDTGRVVRIRKVGPMPLTKLRKDNPPPAAPVIQVDYGDGEKRQEINEADPAYLEAVKRYEIDFGIKTTLFYLERGVVVELGEAEKQEVAEFRQFWQDEYGTPLGGSDKSVYVQYICIGTEDEMNELLEAITRRSHPTEAAVADSVAGFPAEVSGA